MTFMESLSLAVIVFFFAFGIVDMLLRLSGYYTKQPDIKSNHPDKSKMFFDDETREALK